MEQRFEDLYEQMADMWNEFGRERREQAQSEAAVREAWALAAGVAIAMSGGLFVTALVALLLV